MDIITIQKDLAKLSRSVEQQKEYEIYKRDLLRKWRTVTDHVLCSTFPDIFEKRGDAATKLWYSYPPLTDVTTVAMTLVKNDFPYYMEDGIEHWILWKLGESYSNTTMIANSMWYSWDTVFLKIVPPMQCLWIYT